MSGLLNILRRPLVYRTAIGLYVALVLVLAGIIFSVNNLDVETAMYLRADSTLETERTHGARGAFHYAPTGELIAPETLEFKVAPTDATDDPDQHHQIEFVRGSGEESWPTPKFRVPSDLEEGLYALMVEATHDEVDTLETHQRIEITDRPPAAESFDELRWPRPQLRDDDARPGGVVDRIEPDPIVVGQDQDDEQPRRIELAVAPSTGELMRGLPQKLFFRTFDARTGRPVPAELDLEVTRGMPGPDLAETVRTDGFGIGSIDIQPTTALEIDVDVEPDPGRLLDDGSDEADPTWNRARFELDFSAVASQYAMRPASRIVTPGNEVEATVEGTLSDGTFMADLFDVDGDRFIDAHALRMTDGRGGIRFDAPDPGKNSLLLRLQTYQSLYGTNHAWDSGYVVLLEDESTRTLRRTTGELLEWIGDEKGSDHHRYLADNDVVEEASTRQLRRLLDAGLEEIPRTFELPSVLLNTRDADREALDAWREDFKEDLQLMMAVTFGVGVVVVLYLVVVGIRRLRRDSAEIQELTLETDDPIAEEKRKAAKLEQYAVFLQGLIVLSTLIAFGVGILMMVSYL